MIETTTELGRMARERPAAFKRLYAFNYRPADDLHPSQRERFCSLAGDALWSETRSRHWLSECILQHLDLVERPCFDLECPALALASLDAHGMQRLARCVGAVMVGPHVRRSVSRDEVLRWKSRLTPEIYRFVMASAGLLSLPAPAPAIDDDVAIDDIGYGWISASFEDAPEELQVRARLKCPFDVAPVCTTGSIALQFVSSVLSAWEPKWCSSFATRN